MMDELEQLKKEMKNLVKENQRLIRDKRDVELRMNRQRNHIRNNYEIRRQRERSRQRRSSNDKLDKYSQDESERDDDVFF